MKSKGIFFGLFLIVVIFLLGWVLDNKPPSRPTNETNPFRIVTASEAVINPTHQRLMSLPEAKRNEVWTLMFRGSNEKCGTVTKSFYQGSYNKDGSAFWNIRCSRGPDYQVMIANDAAGSTKILECAIVKLLHGECFKTFEEMDRQERAVKKQKP